MFRAKVNMKIVFVGMILTGMTLAACSGGGGSGGGGGPIPPIATNTPVTPSTPIATPMPTNTPAATPTPTTQNLSGSVADFTSGSALSGFTVSLGMIPSASTCLAAQTATSMPCGSPASVIASAVTDTTGAFSVAVPNAGSYMVTIGKDGTYATLHRTISISGGMTALGTAKLLAISAAEQSWLADANNQRATVSVPTSYGNMLVDEYAEEQAHAWAAAISAGQAAPGDAGYAPYQSAYGASPGSMYSAGGVLAVSGNQNAYASIDAGWMAEKSNCPNGNWATCTRAANTGHYINLSNTNTVWVGLGYSPNGFNSNGTMFYPYNLMLIEDLY